MLERNELMRQRLAKIEATRARGEVAYPNDFVPTHTGAELLREVARQGLEPFDAGRSPGTAAVRVAGRVMAINVKGKAAFVRLRDRSVAEVLAARVAENEARLQAGLAERPADASTFQIYVQRNEDEALFDALFKGGDRSLDIGDFLGVTGVPFRTRMGEPSLQACTRADDASLLREAGTQALRVLTRAVRPLPEKWHGLTDKETRHRQRYVDLIVNDDVREIFRRRSKVLKGIRQFLDDRDYVEVETPMMHPVLGGATARPFTTHHNALDMPLYLRIAPELYLKRLVVGGIERVYEINRNFRNEGLSQRHNPEFTMLEFYRAYATYGDLIDEVESMLAGLALQVTGSVEVPYGTDAEGVPRVLSFQPPFQRVTIRDGLTRWAGVPAEELDDIAALRQRALVVGLTFPPGAGLGRMQVELFEHAAEPHLFQPTFVMDFPAETSPLARRNDATPSMVDRFELYAANIEISNAFSELNDPVDQYERFLLQLTEKAKGDEEAMELDLDYVRALEYGMPPAAGCGIGVDRLVMLLSGAESIREVILFPHMRPESRGIPASDTAREGEVDAPDADATADVAAVGVA